MCPRNSWIKEGIGDMDFLSYESLLQQVKEIDSLETVFFGGVAEPISHPDIIKMVEMAKGLGVRVELISNGSLLNVEIIEKLLYAGLSMLWISIDKAHNDSVDKIIEDDGYELAKANLLAFNLARRKINPNAELGIAFVAMKSNIEELPQIIRLGEVMGAREIKISNIIPYVKEMQEEMLYSKSLSIIGSKEGRLQNRRPMISMPIMDFEHLPKEVISSVMGSGRNIKLGENMLVRKSSYCRFIQDDSVFVRWDGEVCPCIGLLHSSKAYLNDMERHIKYCSFGNINNASLKRIWEGEEYTKFRTKVRDFSFSPCSTCGPCSFAENNEEDCFGNLFPTCGACLWSEGFAQCP